MSTVVENNEKRSKNLAVHPATRDKIGRLLEEVNVKKYGRTVRADELVALAVDLLTKEHLETLRQGSLTTGDRVAMDYEKYVQENGPISKDEHLKMVISGKRPLS
jgi:hypothetical protein